MYNYEINKLVFSHNSCTYLRFRRGSTTGRDIRLPENVRRDSSANQGGRSRVASFGRRGGAEPCMLFAILHAARIFDSRRRPRRDTDASSYTENDAENGDINLASARKI